MGRLNYILNIKKESMGDLTLNCKDGVSIYTKKFCYSFTNGSTLNLPSINTLDHGIYLLVGQNGSGKTTLLHLLTGLLKSESQKLFFCGNKDILSINLYDFRHDFLAYVMQEPVFWNTTVENNFSIYLEEKLTYTMVVERIKKLNLNGFVSEAFFTIELWKQNVNSLSVGQRKKLMICIQFIKNKKIYILDEPNASLDDISIQDLRNVIFNKCRYSLFLIVSHDQVYVDICKEKIIFESHNN